MAHFLETFGRPKSCSVTPKGGSALTLKGILSFAPVQDSESLTDVFSDSRQPFVWEGNDLRGCRFTTKDARAFFALKKNTIVSAVSAVVEGAVAGGSSSADVSAALTFAMTTGYVSEAVSLETNADGTPAEMAYTILVCRDPATGTEGTITVTAAGGGD